MVRLPDRPGRIADIVLSLTLLVLAHPHPTNAAGPPAIDWQGDLARAQAEAKAQNRPLWIQFTGPWCHNCHRMDRETFVDAGVVEHAREAFVAVKLPSDVYEQLALGYGLSSLPATVIVMPTGEVVATREGFAEAAEFRSFLDEARGRAGRPRRPAPAPAGPKAEAALALAGYCPVSLVAAHRLVKGRESATVTRDGKLYRFADAEARARFLREPERYVPVNGGGCAVSTIDQGESRAGDPRWGAVYRGHLYVFADAASQERFMAAPERYAHVDLIDRGFCPHCWAREQLLVRGRPQHSLTRSGRRFLFPDREHMAAFGSTKGTTRR